MTYNVRLVYTKEGLVYETTVNAVETLNDALTIFNNAILSEYVVESIYIESN